MNSFFRGTEWYPAERFTNLTKTLFLALFWNALYPQGLFVVAVTFSLNSFLDKYVESRSEPSVGGNARLVEIFRRIGLGFVVETIGWARWVGHDSIA